MPRRVPIADLSAGDRTLGGSLAHYVLRVLRMRAGDAFVAFDPSTGLEADASILPSSTSGSGTGPARGSGIGSGSGETVGVRLGALREGAVRDCRSVIWVQGLTKGNKCDAIVRDATELGASRIVIAAARRSVVRLDRARAAERAERWARIAREAARQCGRSTAPRIDAVLSWDEALSRAGDPHERFCLWEQATEPLGPRLFESLERGAALAFACGPEGGLDREEIELAKKRGWSIASLGRRLLRTETVAAAVLGAVEIASGAFAP
jgi:16S rRNA (uracil1498-N3)-methyltransferase